MSIPVRSGLQETIDRLIATGRYASASDVVEAAIQRLEEEEQQLTWLRAELAKAQEQIDRGEAVLFTRERFELLRQQAIERYEPGKPIKDAVKP